MDTTEHKEPLFNKNYCYLCLANFMYFFSFYLLLPLLPFYLSENFTTDKGIIGIIISTYTVATLFIRPFSGYIMDTFSRKPVYILAFSIFTAVFAGYIVSATLTALIVVRVLHGFSFGLTSVSSNTLVIDVVPSSRRGEGIGYFGVSTNLAMAIGPMVGLLLHGQVSYWMIFLICLLCSLTGVLFALQMEIRFRPPLRRPPLSFDRFILKKGLPGGLAYILIAFPYGQISNYVAMYADNMSLGVGGGIFFIIYAIGLICSRLYSGKMVDRDKIPETVILGIVILVVSIGLLGLCQYFNPTVPELKDALFLLIALLCGAGYGTIFPAFNSLFINLASHNQRGTATSTYLTAWDLGLGLGIVLGGTMAEMKSFSFGYLVSDVVVLAGLLYFCTIVVPHYRRNRVE